MAMTNFPFPYDIDNLLGGAVRILRAPQSQAAVLTEITEVTRTIAVSFAEFTQAILGIIEGDGSSGTVAAAAGVSAQKIQKFGAINSLDEYRFAFISRRHVASGLVTESGGATRGRFVMGCALRASLAAEDASIEQAKGNLTASGVTFRLFPDPDETLSEDSWGFWALEESGTIA